MPMQKSRRSVALVVVLGLVGVLFLFMVGFALWVRPLATSTEPAFVVTEDILIEASADRVWRVLTDFDAYPEWNSYLLAVEGEAIVDRELELTLTLDTWDAPATVRAEVIRFEPGSALAWHGSVLFKGLQETVHIFELTPQPDGRTLLHHSEEFRGWLPAEMYTEAAKAPIHRAFRAMNEELAVRAEGG